MHGLCFFEIGVKVKSIVSFGEYVAWPKNARGVRSVININTTNSCVELPCIAHFVHNKLKNGGKILYNVHQPETYKKYRN